MEIERSRERSLRRQFEYIVQNVQVNVEERENDVDTLRSLGIGTTSFSNPIAGLLPTGKATARFFVGSFLLETRERSECLSSDDDLSGQCR